MVETFRADHVGCYGYQKPTTPQIDKIAAEGVLFQNAFSASNWTMPGVMTVFTSLHPSTHRVTLTKYSLPEEFTTMAAEFRKAGYQTAGIISNPLLSGKFGYARGFDFYDDFTIPLDVGADIFLDGDSLEPPPAFQQKLFSHRITALARSWLTNRRNPDKPFFLFLFYFDPHYDYLPPEPYKTRFTPPDYQGTQDGRNVTRLAGKTLSSADKEYISGLYDAEVRYTDHHVGKLLDSINKLKLDDNTIIVILGDHGDEFWEHNGVAHGHTLYDELIHVPFIIRYPGVVPANSSIDRQVSHLDVMPTILSLAGLPVPEQCRGCALHPGSDSSTPTAQPLAFMESESHGYSLKAVRSASGKIVEKNGIIEAVYNLEKDPAEQNNLLNTPAQAAFNDLKTSFTEWKNNNMTSASADQPRKPKLDPKLVEKLRSLGYVR